MNQKNPFKTPEGYFEGFANNLKDRLSDKASNIPKEEGFVVPENYFDSLHSRISEKLEIGESKVIRLHSYKKYYYAAASLVALVMVIVGLQWGAADEPSFEDLVNSDIDSYFENNEFGLSIYDIGEVIPVDELEINDILENRFTEEYMLNYLDENIEDFEELNLDDNE